MINKLVKEMILLYQEQLEKKLVGGGGHVITNSNRCKDFHYTDNSPL